MPSCMLSIQVMAEWQPNTNRKPNSNSNPNPSPTLTQNLTLNLILTLSLTLNLKLTLTLTLSLPVCKLGTLDAVGISAKDATGLVHLAHEHIAHHLQCAIIAPRVLLEAGRRVLGARSKARHWTWDIELGVLQGLGCQGVVCRACFQKAPMKGVVYKARSGSTGVEWYIGRCLKTQGVF